VIVFSSKSESREDARLIGGYSFFSPFPDFLLLHVSKRKIVMCCLSCNLEDFDFLDLEIRRTRENDFRVQSGVIGVNSVPATSSIG
jgi:hypothetical protein